VLAKTAADCVVAVEDVAGTLTKFLCSRLAATRAS
jgi:hypothetical protein